MADIDDVMERIVNDPSFRGALRGDPRRALDTYDLSPTDLQLLATAITDAPGTRGAVEGRQSRSAMVGMLGQLLDAAGSGPATGSAMQPGRGDGGPAPAQADPTESTHVGVVAPISAHQAGSGLQVDGDAFEDLINPMGDADGDGLPNGLEKGLGTDLFDADTDGDGLSDAEELMEDTNPFDPDTDGDSLADGAEVYDHHTSPRVADTDGDGLSDSAELQHGTSPLAADTDADGLSDHAELHEHGTSPTAPDTDGDGYTDGLEVAWGTDPLDPWAEYDPDAPDLDSDGIPDHLDDDTDNDGLPDSQEGYWSVNGTDPDDGDTDDDGFNDGLEVASGTDPRDPLSHPVHGTSGQGAQVILTSEGEGFDVLTEPVDEPAPGAGSEPRVAAPPDAVPDPVETRRA